MGRILIAITGCALLLIVLWDAFEAIILPRRVSRRIRLVRLFYRSTWFLWSGVARRMQPGKRRESFLAIYGPLSMLLLLVVWAIGLVVGFGLLFWAAAVGDQTAGSKPSLWTEFYFSGTTFVSLGLGDVAPRTPLARAIVVLEGGSGFGFLALVIAYLPVLYQAFSRREVAISLLDARAGSPSNAAELLRRHSQTQNPSALSELLHDWERWSAELLESHLSYPMLCYFRSQHDNQSWLAALTTILDACSLSIVGFNGSPAWQAKLTFAIARHAVVDLAQVLSTPPRAPDPDRLAPATLAELRHSLAAAGVLLRSSPEAERNLTELRRLYEPYVNSLSAGLMLPLPSWTAGGHTVHNWQTSAWERSFASPVEDPDAPAAPVEDEHAW